MAAEVIAKPQETNSVFVLVHGAWHGGWCWKYVQKILQAKGHEVHTPTLTGLGERKHLLDAKVGLQTHIDDIINLIEYRELDNVVLVGHSYAGMVISGVADVLNNKIQKIVYFDAGLPKNGESFISQGISDQAEALAAAEKTLDSFSSDGLTMDVFPTELLGIPASDKINTAWVESKLTPHPLKTWRDPIKLNRPAGEGISRLYIHCVAPALPQARMPAIAAEVSKDDSWQYAELQTGHEAMITAPEELTQLLLSS